MQHLERIAAAQLLINKAAELVNRSIDQEQDAIRRKNNAHQEKIEKSHHYAANVHFGSAIGSATLAGLGLALGAKGVSGAIEFCNSMQNLPSSAAQPFISSNQAEQTKWQNAQQSSQREQQNVQRDQEALERIRSSSEASVNRYLEQLAQSMMRG
ncbi:MAG: hypothetical protein P0S94_03425 [Simkaniaceae bacterium]|nr:hypothetical protein [Simkaniaceae bacterium]